MKASLSTNKIFDNFTFLTVVLAFIVVSCLIFTEQFYLPFVIVALILYLMLMIKFRLLGLITIIAFSMGLINVVALPTITIMGGDFDLRDFMFLFVWLIELTRMLYHRSFFQKNSFAILLIIFYFIVGLSIFRSIFILNLNKVDIFREFRHLMFYSIYFIGLMNIRTKDDVIFVLKAIILFSGLVSLMHIFQGATGIPIMQGRLETASVDNFEFTGVRRVLSSGIVFVIFSLFYLTLNVIYRNYIFSKKYVYLLISLYLTMLLITFGRMTWISIVLSFIVLVFLIGKFYRKKLILSLILCSLLLFAIVLAVPDYRNAFIERYLSIFSEETYQGYSLSHRYTENEDAFKRIIRNPFIGISIGNSYRYNLWEPEFATASTYIHNGYLYFILKFGLIIIIPLVLILIKILKQSYKIYKLKNNIISNMFGLCTLVTIFRLLVTNITQPDFAHYSTATLIGILLAISDCALNLSQENKQLE